MGLEDGQGYDIANLTLESVSAIGALTTCVLIFVKLRGTRDEARTAVRWLKTTITIATLSLFISLGSIISNYLRRYHGLETEASYSGTRIISLVGILFWLWARAMIPVLLVVVGTGIHHSAGSGTTSWGRVVRLGVMGSGTVSGVLAVVFFALGVVAEVHDDAGGVYLWYDVMIHQHRIYLANLVLLFLSSLIVAIWSLSTRSVAGLRSITTLYIVANVLNVVGTGWNMIHYILLSYVFLLMADWSFLLSIFLDTWAAVVLLALIFTVMKKEKNGIWSAGKNYITKAGE